MYYSSQPETKKLVLAVEALDIVQNDPAVAVLFARYGYTTDEIAVGQGLADAFQQAMDAVQYGLSEQMEATTSLKEAESRLRYAFATDRRYVRAALEGRPDRQRGVGVRGKFARSREGFLEQARFFYDAVLADEVLLTQLQEQFDLNRTTIEKRRTAVAAFAAAMQQQQYRKGQLRQLNQQKREALQALDDWMGRFIGIARLALRGQKGQLEGLGLYVA